MLSLGSIGGTTLRVDINFLFLAFFFVAMNYNAQQGLHYALLWIPVLFISVLIHELAHAAAFAMFGYGPSDVVLTGMGGVTVNRSRTKSWHDVVISLAGPISSIVLGFLCGQLYDHVAVVQSDRMLREFVPRLEGANYFWAIFNLIPIAPLDGGHAVRSFFASFLRDRTAFVIYVWIAMIAGVGVIVVALMLRQIFIALYIAWFVWTAWQQWQYFRRYGTPGD